MVTLISLTFVLSGILVSINRYWQYDIYYYDFGIFDQAIWRVSRLKAPVVDHLVIGGKWIFADHFNPSIFILSPLYWLTDDSKIILVAQSLAIGISGLAIYFIGKKVLKDNFSSLAIVITYYSFVGLQNAVITDFHEVTVATLFLSLAFLSYLYRKYFFYFLFLIVTLGFKESMFAVGIGLSGVIYLINKQSKNIAQLTLLISIIWGVASIKLIIPFFSQGVYYYPLKITADPLKLASLFVDNSEKARTIFFSFLSFSFLPLFSPPFWVLIFQDFFSRVTQPWPVRWGLGFHYSAILSVIFAISSIYSLKLVKKKKVLILTSIFLILNSTFLFRFILHGPLLLSINRDFYRHSKDFAFLDMFVTKIPKTASVMTQNNLASHFTHQQVYLIRNDYEKYETDYILIDNRQEQSPTNYFGSDLKLVLEKLEMDENYSLVEKRGEQFLFEKK